MYSSIYHGDKNREFDLAVTLSIRNIDMKQAITIMSVDYHDTSGKLVRSYAKERRYIKPIEALTFVIRESDLTGGPGASFIVRWSAENAVNEPIIESIMIGTKGQQGISFSSRGKRILD
ncbi:MAG: DUF3124 domain-containing protein [Spirochaetes bacterium]|nr:DUF3124 domain-containing protein [Spirochaetota bacterium]